MDDKKTKVTQQFMKLLPHAQALGIEVDAVGDGWAELSMAYDTRFIGDPETGVIHGGAISALMDTCCGAAVMMHPGLTSMTATIDLRIDYMRPATPGQRICARAECYNITRSVAFVRATARDDDSARAVATATGAFTASKGADVSPAAKPEAGA